jgi:3-isopropylmalate/(R)-2-methylmalate dehydratase large subunit
MKFGRLLFLCRHDPAQVREQLAGRVLTRAQVGALRDEISTDEITPLPSLVHFGARLGRHPAGAAAGRGAPRVRRRAWPDGPRPAAR